MICEKCKGKMNWSIEGATQGWRCPMCGWNIITTYIEDIDRDETEYSLYIKNVTEVDAEKRTLWENAAFIRGSVYAYDGVWNKGKQ